MPPPAAHRRRASRLLALPCLISLSGCDPGFLFPSGEAPIWIPCALDEEAGDRLAECAHVSMPLFHEDPLDDRTFEVAVKRLLAPGRAPRNGQHWFLRGGPGYPGTSVLDAFSERVPGLRDTADLYTLDHRGTGASEPLGCPEMEAGEGGSWSFQGCIDEMLALQGDRLDAFTVTESAWDLGDLIGMTREEGQRVTVWGGSYGSFLAQRAMRLFPDLMDGVILEGIVPPDASFMTFDRGMDAAGRALMERCAQEPHCASRLGDDPWRRAGDLLGALDGGHCPEARVDRPTLRYVMGRMLYYAGFHELVPAVVYRLERCGPDDVAAWEHLFDALFGEDGMLVKGGGSAMLYYHVVFSELWDMDDPLSLEALAAELETFTMATGGSLTLASREPLWPTYPPDPLDDAYASYPGPLLMLQGGLDPATPADAARALLDVHDGAHQTWAFVPDGAHGVVGSSPDTRDRDCAAALYLSFVEAPGADLDLSCLEDLWPIDFDGDPELTLLLLGTSDTWGDGDPAERVSASRGLARLPRHRMLDD